MAKIEPLNNNWNAHAALHSALECVNPEDKIVILIEHKGKGNGFRTANTTRADMIHMMELRKFYMFLDD